ncbi:hypothetical protein LINPERPRIM_LOCUS8002 [Linum perenne]
MTRPSPSNTRDRRYEIRRTPSPRPPPPTRGRGRDYGDDDNWRFPTSYRAPPPGPQWTERDHPPPSTRPPALFAPRRESEYESVRNRSRSSRSRSRSPRWQPMRTPGRIDDSGSRRREYENRVYSDDRYVRREDKRPSIGESVPRRELSSKLRWDTLMGDERRPNRPTNLSPEAYRDVSGVNPLIRVSDSGERIGRDRPRTHYDYSMKPTSRDGRFSDWGSDKIRGNVEEPLVANDDYIRPRRVVVARDDDDVVGDGLSYRRRTQLEYGRDHNNGGRLERNGGTIVPRGDELGRLPSPYDGGLYGNNRMYPPEDVGVHNPREMFRRSRSMEVEDATRENQLRNRGSLDDDDGIDLSSRDGNWAYDDMDDELLIPEHSEELRHGREGYVSPLASPQFLSSAQMHPRKRFNASEGNMGNRLGPAQSVKQRLGPRLVPARAPVHVKQRLGPALQPGKSSGDARKVVKMPPWLKVRDNGKQRVSNETTSAKGSKSLEVKEKSMKTEPQENSEEFFQLVNSAFLKLTKSLNENSAKRRKYTEQGGAGVLRCSVCGSNSKDFTDTLSLAQHACTPAKAGCRAEHLGFHKALCLLMGWKWDIGDVVKGPWVRQKLSDDEASSLNEDLILWPPVVIVHNSSISNENHSQRIVVSIEDLRSILKGKGFSSSITNICRGKAANQSVMVVTFAATFSGLQEAEKLHKLYSENKHGRPEFQQITSTNDDKKMVEEGEANDKEAEAVLYGFLGIACDLDKLDFEMKKRCVVKSKKEIDAISVATLES